MKPEVTTRIYINNCRLDRFKGDKKKVLEVWTDIVQGSLENIGFEVEFDNSPEKDKVSRYSIAINGIWFSKRALAGKKDISLELKGIIKTIGSFCPKGCGAERIDFNCVDDFIAFILPITVRGICWAADKAIQYGDDACLKLDKAEGNN